MVPFAAPFPLTKEENCMLLDVRTYTCRPGTRVYENAADREKRRAAMWADAQWVAYTQESAKLGALEAQENRLMTPVEFFPIRR